VDGFTSRPFSATTIPPLKVPGNLVSVEEIIDTSRKLYTLPKKEIEDQINRWSGNMGGRDDEFGGETGKDGAGMFKAKCAICGKDIMVPFEPEPGRPIYCKEDLAKIKAGEIQPVKSSPRTEQQINKTYDDLSALGIEFKMVEDGSKKVPLPARALDSRPKNKPIIRHEPRTAPDTGELQAALKSALSTILPTKKVEPKTEIKKEEVSAPTPKIIPKEEPTHISLSSLKQDPEVVKPAYVQAKKEASAEHVSALKDVIAKAMADKKPAAETPKNEDAEKQKEALEKEAKAKEVAEKEKQEQERKEKEAKLEEERKRIELESMKKAEEEMNKRMIEEEALKKKEEEVARIAEENRKHVEELERQNEKREEEAKKNAGEAYTPRKPQEVPEEVLRKILEEK
jgi:CxxC-x17-CxxC domain-containing protein